MKIAIGQINPKIGDFSRNCQKILDYSRMAERSGADIIVFPELCLCGYPPMDLLDYESFIRENLKALARLREEAPKDIVIAVGHLEKNCAGVGRPLKNTVSIITGGRIIHSQDKTLLPSYDVFDETRYFEPASDRRIFSFKNRKIGIAVCEDIWWETEPLPGAKYPLNPVKDLIQEGADLILVPSASPYYHGKAEIRKKLVTGIGKNSSVPVVYVNMVGGNDSLIFDGHSFITDRDGNIVCTARGFEEDFVLFDLSGPFSSVSLEEDKYNAIRKALVLGLKDYMDKCGFAHAHLGLSGGIDSALVAVIAAEALGPDRVKAFALPSRYSSEGSLKDAESLAGNLGIDLSVISIEGLFSHSLTTLEPVFSGKDPDITEENLQARIRGFLLMAYSNKWNSLLLTTGNKSELAVGYCTLYGDMCGGISVIGDLFKTEVFELCRYINREAEIIPESILAKPPSAELRPNQKDQDSLPPYDILDSILDLYLIKNLSREDILARGFSEERVVKVISLVAGAEYKRRQAPPVLKVSSKAFGMGRRVPIARSNHE